MPVDPDKLLFFLGGRDLEMETIAQLLNGTVGQERIRNRRLAWGAKISDYKDGIVAAIAEGRRPVLVELTDDLPADAFDRSRALVVDHHGALAGHDRPSSLCQVFNLLGLKKNAWSREFALVEANDRGHIAAMKEMGASDDEIRDIRVRDRRCQGVTADDEAAAQEAVVRREELPGLTVVRPASGGSSAVADFMDLVLGGPGYIALMVVLNSGISVFGPGATIRALAADPATTTFGGDLPLHGFWYAAAPGGTALLAERIKAILIGPSTGA